MSNRDQSEFHWKTKLEDAASLPAEGLADKGAAWEKLHNRLQTKRGTVKAGWYWMAAASLLLLLTLPLITPTNRYSNMDQTAATIDEPAQTLAPNPGSNERKATAVVTPMRSRKQQEEQAVSTVVKKLRGNNRVDKEEAISYREGVVEDIPQAAIPSELAADVVENRPVAALVKTKLKVVHINELEEPGDETPNTARSYERHSFKVKLINQDVYLNPSLPSGYTLLLTKNIPSN